MHVEVEAGRRPLALSSRVELASDNSSFAFEILHIIFFCEPQSFYKLCPGFITMLDTLPDDLIVPLYFVRLCVNEI